MTLETQHRDTSEEWIHVHQPEPLKVLIVGGGIAGLSAAIALRQQGHIVEIFESSAFSREVGAALHLAPNGNGALKGLGIFCKEVGANQIEWMSEWTSDAVKVNVIDLIAGTRIFEHKWRLAHRVKLHEALRKAATSETGLGQPAQLHLSKSVQDVDPTNGIISFKDGTSVQGDVVIGADGVHSITRTKLPGGDLQPFPSGRSAFRFMIPTERVLSDPRTRKFAEANGNMNGVFGSDRGLVIYPTNDNTVLNFVCIHPDSVVDTVSTWGNSTTVSTLLETYKDFHPDILALLDKADESSLKIWKLLDMDVVPSYYHGRLAVIGDAAHPFLPFLGMGGSVAIEDAVAIGVILERGTNRDEIPERLALYQQVRKERAELIQYYSRLNGQRRGDKKSFDMAKHQAYCFGHNEWHHSAQKLRVWKWDRLDGTSDRRTTTVFGPSMSLQSAHRSPVTPNIDPTFTVATIRFNTSRTILDGLLPRGNKRIRFTSPGTIAQCTFRQTSFRGLPSLAGRGYNQLGLYIHGLEYEADDQTVSGCFLPIMFENLADTITAGREELGVPKVWSTIEVERDRKSYHVRTGWEGLTWGNFYLNGLELVKPKTVDAVSSPQPVALQDDEGVILHRYTPPVEAGREPSEWTTFVPRVPHDSTLIDKDTNPAATAAAAIRDAGVRRSIPQRVWRAKDAQFSLNARDWEAFPTLHHIISRLEEIPLHSVIEARVIEGSGIPDLF